MSFEDLQHQVEALLKNQKFKDALFLCEKGLESFPEEPWLYQEMGNIYSELGDSENAKEYYIKALQQNSDYVSAHYNLGVLYFETNELDSARECLEKCIELDPEFSMPYDALASVKDLQGLTEEAESLYKRALYYEPDSLRTQLNLADLYIEHQRTVEALSILDGLSSKNIENFRLFYLIGKAYVAGNEPDKALVPLLRAHILEPDSADINYVIGGIYYNQEKYEKALKFLQQHLDLTQEWEFKPVFFMAASYDQLGQPDKAITLYQKSFEINPNSEEVLYRLALHHEIESEFDEALKYFANLLEQFPNSRYAPASHFSLGHIYQQIQEHSLAKLHYQHSIEAQYKAAVCYESLAEMADLEGELLLSKHYRQQALIER